MIQLLNSNKISYKILQHSKPVFTCEEAANERGVPIDEMIKCMLLVDKDSKFVLVCLPGNAQLDLKKAQEVSGLRRLSFASKEQIKEVLGFEQGAISPVAIKTSVLVIFDKHLQQKFKVNMSSGDASAGIELNRKELLTLINPIVEEVCK